jgi:hypothetical protein
MGSPFIFFLLLASLADMRSPAIAITAAGIVDVTNPVIDRKIERSQLHSTPETKYQVISMVIVAALSSHASKISQVDRRNGYQNEIHAAAS